MLVKTNKSCALLTDAENQKIFSLLGDGCESLCTTVVQVCATAEPYHDQWVHSEKGVLCFEKDSIQKSFFFRLYCLYENCLLWEHPLYSYIAYDASTLSFHIFEAENCIIAFNFAHAIEAGEFKKIVLHKIKQRNKRLERKYGKELGPSSNQVEFLVQPPLQDGEDVKMAVTAPSLDKNPKKKENEEKKANKKKVSKTDIGSPQDFQSINGLEYNDLDKLFKNAGVLKTHLSDAKTRSSIAAFIEEKGGRNAVRAYNEQADEASPSSKLPSRPAPSRPPAQAAYRKNIGQKTASPEQGQPPSSPDYEPPQSFTPPTAPLVPPPDFPESHDVTKNNDFRAQMHAHIRQGVTLKPVNQSKVNKVTKPVRDNNGDALAPSPPPLPKLQLNPDDLFEEHVVQRNDIQQRIEFKHVTDSERIDAEPNFRQQHLEKIRQGIVLRPANRKLNQRLNNENDLAEALRNHLEERIKVIQGSESDGSCTSTEDDEKWS